MPTLLTGSYTTWFSAAGCIFALAGAYACEPSSRARDAGTRSDASFLADGGRVGDGGPRSDGGDGSDASTDPLERVPPERLSGVLADCPGAFAATAPIEGENAGWLAGGQTRSFLLRRPPASFMGPRPVFFAFHGTNETASGFLRRTGLGALVDRGFVVVAPQSNGNGTVWPVWDGLRLPEEASLPNADLALFDSLLSCLAAHFELDRHRTYAGGHSAGGIFLNHLLRSRSEVLAGGIVGSGVFSFTAPSPTTTLGELIVLVTWGGDNDQWSGSTGGVSGAINFVEEASLASAYYQSEPKALQAYCRGENLGHAWLDGLNPWMADLLLSRPKGLQDPLQLVPLPAGAQAMCSTDAYGLQQEEVTCGSSAVAACTAMCQLVGDCAVVNNTVGPLLADQLSYIGFNSLDCSTCLSNCAAVYPRPVDAQVIQCVAAHAANATCGLGMEGAAPLFEAINTCCEGALTAELCQICEALPIDSAFRKLLPVCD